MKYRIVKMDKWNWNTEQWEPGGEVAKRGRTAGKPKAARWITLGHFPNLKHAAISLLDDAIGHEAAAIEGKEILAAIERAEAKVIRVVQATQADPEGNDGSE